MRSDSGIRHHLRTVGVLWLTVALIAGLAGCAVTRYEVTFSSTEGGSVTSPGEGTFRYDFCTGVDLVASPDSGYRFVGWGGGGAPIEDVTSPVTIITSVHGNYKVKASFQAIPPDQFELIVSSTAGGSVTAPSEGTFVYGIGTLVNLVAAPASGYEFVSWTGNVGTIADVNSPTTTINMQGSYAVVANFQAITPVTYNLNISSTAGGSVTVPGEGTFGYGAGTVVGLTATPAAGYRFVNWTGNVGTVASPTSPTTTITMQGNYSIAANFEVIPAVTYNLNISSTTGGSVTAPGEGTFGYGAGTVVGLTASPAGGYRFVNWSGNVGTVANVNSASTSITMQGNYSIVANFEPIQAARYTLTISSGSCGSVTEPGEGVFTYDAGTVVTLLATPVRRYEFVGWSGDVGTIADVNSASTTIVMNGNYTIRADFQRSRRLS
ncbi:MAG: InlB B-repeat-containing protein [Dehalococcoidia bacterium]|nr:InlB B-repeat-containing protein [Dehalococcoidia bacterium]